MSQSTTQAKFLAELGSKSSVPIISFSANSPTRYPSQTPYFIRTGWNDTAQAEAIASFVQKYNWRDNAMDGALGFEPYVKNTWGEFRQRWREKYQSENPSTSLNDTLVYGLYAYDTVWALALAAERTAYGNSDSVPPETNYGSTDFDRISTSKVAEKLLTTFLKSNFSGVTGKFRIQDRQLISTTYNIINVVGQEKRRVGFWTPRFNISKSMEKNDDLDTIIWPGRSRNVPRGWLLPANKKLKIGAPVKPGFGNFIRYENGKAAGFCGDVFEEVVRALPYKVPIHYEEFADGKGQSIGTYDELVYKVYRKV
jgi:glutamate receptor, ionotropic, plant